MRSNLKRANALLRRHEQVRCGQPFVQRECATLVQRADSDRERLAAGVALVQAGTRGLALHERGFVYHATMRADRPILPQPSLKPLAGLVSSWKIGSGQNSLAHGGTFPSD